MSTLESSLIRNCTYHDRNTGIQIGFFCSAAIFALICMHILARLSPLITTEKETHYIRILIGNANYNHHHPSIKHNPHATKIYTATLPPPPILLKNEISDSKPNQINNPQPKQQDMLTIQECSTGTSVLKQMIQTKNILIYCAIF